MSDFATFKKGDVVQLKSGGPAMTITFYDERYKKCSVSWFVNGTVNEAEFPSESLKLSTAGKSVPGTM